MASLNTYSIGGVYVNTTDATVTTAATFQTKTDKAYQVVATITGVNTTTFAATCAYYLRAVFLNDGGTLAQQSSTQSIAAAIETAALSGADAGLDASGTTIRARVTGVAATSLTWLVSAEITEVGAWADNGGLV